MHARGRVNLIITKQRGPKKVQHRCDLQRQQEQSAAAVQSAIERQRCPVVQAKLAAVVVGQKVSVVDGEGVL